jgi:hypothetical protein
LRKRNARAKRVERRRVERRTIFFGLHGDRVNALKKTRYTT